MERQQEPGPVRGSLQPTVKWGSAVGQGMCCKTASIELGVCYRGRLEGELILPKVEAAGSSPVSRSTGIPSSKNGREPGRGTATTRTRLAPSPRASIRSNSPASNLVRWVGAVGRVPRAEQVEELGPRRALAVRPGPPPPRPDAPRHPAPRAGRHGATGSWRGFAVSRRPCARSNRGEKPAPAAPSARRRDSLRTAAATSARLTARSDRGGTLLPPQGGGGQYCSADACDRHVLHREPRGQVRGCPGDAKSRRCLR